MTQKAQVIAVLTEAPATSIDVADLTGLPLKQCGNELQRLRELGIASRTKLRREGAAGHPQYLYTLKGSRP